MMRTSINHPDFNLAATLESGQVFGFEKSPDGAYEGRVSGISIRLRQPDGGARLIAPLQIECANAVSRIRIVHYFDLDRDLSEIYRVMEDARLRFSAKQRGACLPVRQGPAFGWRGLRIIRQDSWEALACFILSSNNNVKRIQGIWKNMARHYGAFPKAAQIARTHERILRGLGLGYRAPFLQSTASFVAANPICLETIREAPYEEAVRRVLAFPGIGPKVADCVLLYGFHKLEAFPVDVWMLRIMRKLYFRGRAVSEKRVQAFGQKRWGANAGYIQQYLFHAARMNAI